VWTPRRARTRLWMGKVRGRRDFDGGDAATDERGARLSLSNANANANDANDE
jgi:hypothetical protein